MDIIDLLKQLELVACNVDNVKKICNHPFVTIVEMQLKDAIELAKELTDKEP